MSPSLKNIIAGGPQSIIRAAGRAIGLEIRRNGPSARDELRLAQFLRYRNIELLLDVGANRGQFAQQMFDAGFAGHIISFEALPGAHAALSASAKEHDGCWTVAPMCALSDSAGEVMFNLNTAEATSSLLEASTESLQSIPGLRPQSKVKVRTLRLDDVLAEYDVDQKAIFLKIDVQGGEGLVLAGAKETLKVIDGLVVELSLTQLYAGQPLMLDVLTELCAAGFHIVDISPAYRDPATYQLQQVDAVLFRNEA